MSKNRTYALVLAMLIGTGSQAQVMTLRSVLDTIRTSHPVIRMYDNDIRSMDEAAKGARSSMPTQLGTGFFMTPYDPSWWKADPGMPGMRGNPGMGSFMVSGEQMFPNRKKLDADEAYMKAMSSSEKERKNATLNELLAEAKLNYFEWVLLRRRIGVLRENEKILDFMIRNAEIRYRNNMEKISAYYKAKAALGDVKNMKLMYESDIRERRIRLNALMGRKAGTPLEIDTSYRIRDFADIEFDSTLFYGNRSDLKAIDRQIDVARLKMETERASLKPQFGVKYDHMFGFGGSPMLFTMMGMVRVPLFAGASKMSKANVESLKWKTRSLQAQKEMLVNEYSGMAYGMRNELELKMSQMKLYEEEIIPALRNNYRTMQLAYEQNTGELFMLYDAWETLNMKQLEYLKLVEDALRLQVSIERLIEKTNLS
jgi:outer membrane protein TolC